MDNYFYRTGKCKFIINNRLGHRKFRYLYKQKYHEQFWLNKDIKALGYGFSNNALVAR
jgi:hypothetical protein